MPNGTKTLPVSVMDGPGTVYRMTVARDLGQSRRRHLGIRQETVIVQPLSQGTNDFQEGGNDS